MTNLVSIGYTGPIYFFICPPCKSLNSNFMPRQEDTHQAKATVVVEIDYGSSAHEAYTPVEKTDVNQIATLFNVKEKEWRAEDR